MSKLEELKDVLRSAYRIKYGVDYACTMKYGQLRVMCNHIWRPNIKYEADRLGLEVHEWFTYT